VSEVSISPSSAIAADLFTHTEGATEEAEEEEEGAEAASTVKST
jgi:hypothetical protein